MRGANTEICLGQQNLLGASLPGSQVCKMGGGNGYQSSGGGVRFTGPQISCVRTCQKYMGDFVKWDLTPKWVLQWQGRHLLIMINWVVLKACLHACSTTGLIGSWVVSAHVYWLHGRGFEHQWMGAVRYGIIAVLESNSCHEFVTTARCRASYWKDKDEIRSCRSIGIQMHLETTV